MGIPCQKSMLPGVNKWRPVTNAQNNRSLAQLNNYPPAINPLLTITPSVPCC